MPVMFHVWHMRNWDAHGQRAMCGKWSPQACLTSDRDKVSCLSCFNFMRMKGR